VRALALACLLLAACEAPPLTLRYQLTAGDSQQCTSENNGMPTTDCADISMDCRAVLSIRIVPPNDPDVPYISVCQALPLSTRQLCGIAGVDLPPAKDPIPEQVLEVQMAVFPIDDVPEIDGKLVCPIVEFGVDGLPTTQACSSSDTTQCPGRPAVGGRAFYHPGDEETLVTLGCTEIGLLRGDKCTNLNRTTVIATVNEFEFPASVEQVTANRLLVSVGEPVPGSANNYVLDISRTHPLMRDTTNQFPYTWSNEFTDLNFTKSFCLEVLEDVPMATRTLTCRPLPGSYPDSIDALGTRLKPETLAMILKAANLTAFPSKGLVVGIVLSQAFLPVSGVKVQANCPMDLPTCGAISVQYLSEDRLSLTTDNTHSTGIFISTDAPFRSTFNRLGQAVPLVYGGLVDNKVTTVVIQETGIGGM
jgi:hypothetical protein